MYYCEKHIYSQQTKKKQTPQKRTEKKYINQIIHTPKIKSQKTKKFNILCGKFCKLIVGLKKIYILEILSKSVFIFL